MPSAAASTVAVWNASASASAGSLTLYSSEAPRDRAALTSLVSPSASPPAVSSTARPSVASATFAASSMAMRSYSPSTMAAWARSMLPSGATATSWLSGVIL